MFTVSRALHTTPLHASFTLPAQRTNQPNAVIGASRRPSARRRPSSSCESRRAGRRRTLRCARAPVQRAAHARVRGARFYRGRDRRELRDRDAAQSRQAVVQGLAPSLAARLTHASRCSSPTRTAILAGIPSSGCHAEPGARPAHARIRRAGCRSVPSIDGSYTSARRWGCWSAAREIRYEGAERVLCQLPADGDKSVHVRCCPAECKEAGSRCTCDTTTGLHKLAQPFVRDWSMYDHVVVVHYEEQHGDGESTVTVGVQTGTIGKLESLMASLIGTIADVEQRAVSMAGSPPPPPPPPPTPPPPVRVHGDKDGEEAATGRRRQGHVSHQRLAGDRRSSSAASAGGGCRYCRAAIPRGDRTPRERRWDAGEARARGRAWVGHPGRTGDVAARRRRGGEPRDGYRGVGGAVWE